MPVRHPGWSKFLSITITMEHLLIRVKQLIVSPVLAGGTITYSGNLNIQAADNREQYPVANRCPGNHGYLSG